MRKGPFPSAVAIGLVTLVMLAPAAAFAAVPGKKLPKDVCALLTDEQVTPLVPSVASEPLEALNEVGCHWEDGGDPPQSLATLTVNVTKLPGLPLAQLKLSLKAEAQDYDGDIIKHLGKFATQQSVIPPNTEVTVALKGSRLLSVEFSGDGPVTAEQEATTLELARAIEEQL